jgi:hypothetical protein
MTPVTGRPSVSTETPDSNALATDSRTIRQHPPRLVITGTSSYDFTGRQRSERNTEGMVEWVRHVRLDLFGGATTDTSTLASKMSSQPVVLPGMHPSLQVSTASGALVIMTFQTMVEERKTKIFCLPECRNRSHILLLQLV